jgi:hypothetical protein
MNEKGLMDSRRNNIRTLHEPLCTSLQLVIFSLRISSLAVFKRTRWIKEDVSFFRICFEFSLFPFEIKHKRTLEI